MITDCPACNAYWTLEEIEDQLCGCCGYPHTEEQLEIYDCPKCHALLKEECVCDMDDEE